MTWKRFRKKFRQNATAVLRKYARKASEQVGSRNGKIDRFEYRRRDRDLAENFTNFESERRDQIERQMDEVVVAARHSARRTFPMACMCGSAKYFISNKTKMSQIPSETRFSLWISRHGHKTRQHSDA